jgi:hypothetical protein
LGTFIWTNLGENESRPYNNLEGNELQVFSNYSDSLNSAKQYLEDMKSCEQIGFGRLVLEIAENEEDAERFKRKSRLIVIMKWCEFGIVQNRLLGPIVGGKFGFGAIPGGFLSATDFETYTFANSPHQTPFERAKYLSSEVIRQGQCGATIARFDLRRFKRRLVR